MSALGRVAFLAVAVTTVACAQPAPAPPPDTRAADEARIRAAVKEWSAAAEARDADKFASFYADDGVLQLHGVDDPTGKAAIRGATAGMMQDPNFALSFASDRVVVARSGDLAYETGTYTMTMTGPDKKPDTEKGHYVVVWGKQADGGWKALVDSPTSDAPETAAAAKP
jgi:uncharacterized protein (TIGR02246 family)